ncbi:hypothetical protein OAU56_00490 [Nitrosopumilus sp.]|jgi:hypothetical protein|nr:hypothetical protein [Nitrosopumilus sp.]MDC0438108.1 hypothetical protein [Nitrosopumilus sp.]MDC0522776.1 hypothetical protein [Nitrosopumilus sp.]MDC3291690.1 hypothetical protein [Nitrosopumilus sp.]|tara:strand:+ start:518 stop:1147 length:630 start_codon:yes stop_codon:yes gene_type:complete
MNKKIILPVLIIIVSAIVFFLIPENSSMPSSENLYQYGFTFYDVEHIKESLSEQNIFMSTPSPITDHTIENYCAIRADILSTITYCTTTAIQGQNGKSLGNISMGGSPDNPIMAIAAIDSSPSFDSKSNEVEIVFETMVETLVCECWNEKQPGGFESVNDWLDAAKIKYAESSQDIPLKSTITGLGDETLILEVTLKNDSYLWTLIILK